MNCASCGRTNPTEARFCAGCGTSLAPRCPACGAECTADASFCIGCGAALAAHPAADAVSRKIVTIVFADLIGSMSLHERLDAESARSLMDRYHRAMSAAVDVHGGRVVQLLGDGVLAAFGVPRVAEDDAIRAVRAAVGMQRAFRELAREQSAAMEGVGLRVAVNTGEIVVSDDANSVMGDPTNVAARLQQEARDGDVIVGEGTQRLVRELVTLAPLGTFALRGRAESVAAYRVVSLDRPASAQAIAFVGREDELRRLVAVYDAAVTAPAARLAVLLGSPGLGKSRLVAEFTRRAGERATVLAARCDAAGGATFAPLADALRALLRIDEGAGGDVLRAAIDAVVSGDDAERTRIATGIGSLLAGTPAPPEETFFVVRRLLAALAAVRPVVLVIDDLHWAEPLLLDLVEHLVQWSSSVPLLVLVAARSELRDARSSLTVPGSLVTDVVTLGGLDAGAATRLAANVIGGAELPAALAGRVLATSEGNPLFVSELVRMLVQDGTLARDGERWITTVEVAKLDMPATIQVLLAARIERLRPEERSVLERAAVIGRQFSRAAVAQLLPHDAHDLDVRLEALRRSELIEPDTGWFLGEPALRFHHVLIRDAAYRRVLKETRAELHARIADWIGARAGEAIEHDETIGWHLEQAHQHLRELGTLDDNGRSLGERAARHLGAAGRRALARDDLPLAAGLLGRALERLDPADAARADLALDWCEALLAGGDVGPAVAAIDELGRFCADSARLRAWHICFAGQLAVLTDPQALHTTAETVAAAADELVALGDAAGEAKAHFVHAMALVRLGQVGACEAALDRALAAARRARDRRRANAVLAGAPVAALWGPSPVTRASGRCLDVVRVLRITHGAPAVEAVALRCQGVLEALRGRTEAARRMIASSRHLVEELGITQRLLEADVFAGHVELIEGDAEAAERWLRSAYIGLRNLGLGIDAAQAGALLGRALLAQDRAAEAEALSHESEALAGDDLKAAITWRGVRAEALARRGEHAAAIEFAQAAVEIAAATDDLLDHADARQSLAVALRAAGRDGEADAEQARAIELWDAKGATLLVERARRDTEGSCNGARALAETVEPQRRQLRPNHATRHLARIDEAVAARDLPAIVALVGEARAVDHAAGRSYDAGEAVELFGWMLEHFDALEYRHTPLAVLGSSLALARSRESGSAPAGAELPFGRYEFGGTVLIEADSELRATGVELFPAGKLADAIARLYERYAELLPDGPERDRSAATARSVAVLSDPSRFTIAFEPGVEAIDHRIVGFGSLRGTNDTVNAVRSLLELGVDNVWCFDDVLGLRPDALLIRSTDRGTDRSGGGDFERRLCQLWCFGTQGLVTRWEQFDAEQEAAALARFDDLTGAPAVARRPVRPNFASEVTRRLNAAVAARDVSALAHLWAADAVILHHPTGLTYGRDAAVGRFRFGFESATGLSAELVTLATLGPSLGLARLDASATGVVSDGQSFGAMELHPIILTEANERSQAVRVELFADDHLADAIVRLYERHAELLPDGHERERAAATARSVGAGLRSGNHPPEWMSPEIEFIDHRRMGIGSARGIDAMVRGHRAQEEVAADLSLQVHDVIALRPDAFLVSWTTSGTHREGGGAFERQYLMLRAYDSSGLARHMEWFDVDDVAAALARFDALTTERPASARSVRLGDSLALVRVRRDEFAVVETGADAQQRRIESFAPDRLAAAITRLYERYAELLPQGAAREIAALAARAIAWSLGLGDRHDYEAFLTSDVAFVDHRLLGFPPARGVAAFREFGRILNEVADDLVVRVEDALALEPRGFLVRTITTGIDRTTGGRFEREIVQVRIFDADGRLQRTEWFDGDQVEPARVRFAALTAPTPPRRVQQNAASASGARLRAAVPSRDLDAIAALIADDFVLLHHPTGATIDREAGVQRWRMLFQAEELQVAWESIATLGDSLELGHDVTSFTSLAQDELSFGASRSSYFNLGEVNDRGQAVRIEVFSDAHLGDAIVRLYQRHAELVSGGPEGFRAGATARSVAAVLGLAGDDAAFRAVLSPAIEFVDHQQLGMGRARADLVRRGNLVLHEVADHVTTRVDELLALRSDGLVACRTIRGIDRTSGGEFERQHLELWVFGSDGLLTHLEHFDCDDGGAALARFDALTAAAFELQFANAASRCFERSQDCWAARDFDGVLACHAPTCVMDDRRAMVRLELTSEQFVANQRVLFDVPWIRFRGELLATRGERLALFFARFAGEAPGSGEIQVDHLALVEVDAAGRSVAIVIFDPEAREAAHAELDRRYAAGEGAPQAALLANLEAFRAGAAAGDRDALMQLLPDDFTLRSHRRFGNTGTLFSRDAYVASLHAVESLGVRGGLRLDHLRLSATAVLGDSTWYGTRDGGDFELPVVVVLSHDGGHIRRAEFFDPEQLDEARTLYADLSRREPRRALIENLATRTNARFERAFAERNEDALAALCTPAFQVSDRRRMLRLEMDRETFLDSVYRALATDGVSLVPAELLATRGDRLALLRTGFRVEPDDAGPSEIEFLLVSEVDEAGKRVATVVLDPDDLDTAYAELDVRYAAREAVAERRAAVTHAFSNAFAARDWDALAALLAPDLVVQDHRLLGWETLHGPAAYVQALQTLVDLAPDVRLRIDHVSIAAPRFLYVTTWVGTRDGGAFETPSVIVAELDDDGRIRRFDQYDIDRLDEIRAGFAATPATSGPDPLRIPPNAASRAADRRQQAFDARDWDALAALCAPELVFEDRRRVALTSGGCEMWLASNRVIAASATRMSRTLLATAGDRLALEHIRWSALDGVTFEAETLTLVEVDAAGRIVAIVGFDADDRRAAAAEMFERFYLRTEDGRRMPRGRIEFTRALHLHDLEAMRAALPPDFRFSDFRRTGIGATGTADDYIAWMAAAFEQSDDVAVETLYHVAIAEWGVLSLSRAFGTLRVGGPFETPVVRINRHVNGRWIGAEVFEPEDLDRARARFEELGREYARDPLRIPPNAASRAGERLYGYALAADWDALRDLCAPIVFDDRRPLFRISGDCDLIVANTQAIDRSIWEGSTRTLLATAGDRLALHHNRWRGGEAGGEFEVETLEITEVDAEGRVVAAIVFDPGDRRAAGAELIQRYAAGGGLRFASRMEMARALSDHDLDRLRAALPDGFVFHDHRRVGAGRLEGDAYVAWLAGLFEQSADALIEPLYVIAEEPHAVLSVGHTFGTRVDGGAFESVFVQLATASAVELFELDDLDRARVRFEELRPDPLRIPLNAATRAMDRLRVAREASDWDAMAALCSPSMLFEDRRRAALLRGDREMFLASARVVASYEAQISPTLLATVGDRVALRRLHFAGNSGGGGAAEADALSLVEVDAEGRITAIIAFDPDDRRAASLEMIERFARSDEAPPFFASQSAAMRGLVEHDLEPLRAALPADFYIDDHRHAGLGRIDGASVFIESLAALFEQSADLVVESLYTIAIHEHGLLDMAHMFGTLRASGGDFESVYLRLFVFDANGPVGMELFEPGALDAARARLDALRPAAAPIAPNAATRASARMAAVFAAEEWQPALRALASPSFRFEDRRRRALVDGDIEVWIRNLEVVRGWPDRRTRGALLAALGERVAIDHIHYQGDADGASYEGEFVRVVEVDGDGLLQAVLHFDPEDRTLAFEEAQRRFAAGRGNEPA